MFHDLLRQRRRIAVALLFSQMAAFAVRPDIVGASAAAVATVLVAAIIIMVVPARRHWIECAAFGVFVAVWLPAPAFLPAVIVVPFVLHYILYSPVLDTAPLRLSVDCKRTSYVAQTSQSAWNAIVPGASHPDDHWSGALVDYDSDVDDPETLYLRFREEDGLFDDMTVSFVTRTAPFHARFLQERGDETCLVTLDLTPLSPGRTEIRSHMLLDDLPLRIALTHWFDDTYGDELDFFAETLNARRRWRVSTWGRAAPVLHRS